MRFSRTGEGRGAGAAPGAEPSDSARGAGPASAIGAAGREFGRSRSGRVSVGLAIAGTWLLAALALALAVWMNGSADRQVYYDLFDKPLYSQWGTHTAMFFYSPAAAQLMMAIRVIPFTPYLILFAAAGCVAVAWMVAPLGIRWAPQAFLVALPVTLHGGMEWIFALVAVLALRYPAVWAIPVLTKVTPGVGAFYYIGRRDWRSFAIAVGVTLAIAVVSALVAPNYWHDWFAMLWTIAHDTGADGFGSPLLPVPLVIRGPIALALCVWGGARNRPWTILAAMILGRPDLGYQELAMLVALPRLIGLADGRGVAADARSDASGATVPVPRAAQS